MNRTPILIAFAAFATVPLCAQSVAAQQFDFHRSLRFTLRPSLLERSALLAPELGQAPSVSVPPSASATQPRRPDCPMPVAVPDLSRSERMPGSHAPTPDVVARGATAFCYNPLGPGRAAAARP
jgi:hypothetical protein